VTIYVLLPDEPVTAWRPVEAEHMGENTYRILSQPYDETEERWEFVPGDEVICEQTKTHDGSILTAKRLVEPSRK
jgi:hypothetical protein